MAIGVPRAFGIGAFAARAALAWIRRDPRAAELDRTNFRGRTVTLAGGPALAAGATVGAACRRARPARRGRARSTAGAASGAVGLYDDVVGGRPEQKAPRASPGTSARCARAGSPAAWSRSPASARPGWPRARCCARDRAGGPRRRRRAARRRA